MKVKYGNPVSCPELVTLDLVCWCSDMPKLKRKPTRYGMKMSAERTSYFQILLNS